MADRAENPVVDRPQEPPTPAIENAAVEGMGRVPAATDSTSTTTNKDLPPANQVLGTYGDQQITKSMTNAALSSSRYIGDLADNMLGGNAAAAAAGDGEAMKPGDHVHPKTKAKYTVNEAGDIVSFTPVGKDGKEMGTYKFEYNDKHQVVNYHSPNRGDCKWDGKNESAGFMLMNTKDGKSWMKPSVTPDGVTLQTAIGQKREQYATAGNGDALRFSGTIKDGAIADGRFSGNLADGEKVSGTFGVAKDGKVTAGKDFKVSDAKHYADSTVEVNGKRAEITSSTDTDTGADARRERYVKDFADTAFKNFLKANDGKDAAAIVDMSKRATDLATDQQTRSEAFGDNPFKAPEPTGKDSKGNGTYTVKIGDGNYTAHYNNQNEQVRIDSPSGSFVRVSAANSDGNAYWQRLNEAGKPVNYSGHEGRFVGKVGLDDSGIHVQVAKDSRSHNQNQWTGMVERTTDGTLVRSANVTDKEGHTTGFTSTVIMPDGSQVHGSSKVVDGKVQADSKTDVYQGDRDAINHLEDGKIVAREGELLARAKMRETSAQIKSNERLALMLGASFGPGADGSVELQMRNSRRDTNYIMNNGTQMESGNWYHGTHTGEDVRMRARAGNNALHLDIDKGIKVTGSGYGPLGLMVHTRTVDVKKMEFDFNDTSGHKMRSFAQGQWGAVRDGDLNANGEGFVGFGRQLTTAVNLAEDTGASGRIDRTSPESFSFSASLANQATVKELQAKGIGLGQKISGEFHYAPDFIGVTDMKGIKVDMLGGANVHALFAVPDKGGKIGYAVDATVFGNRKVIPVPEALVSTLMKQVSGARDGNVALPRAGSDSSRSKQHAEASVLESNYGRNFNGDSSSCYRRRR